MVCFDHVGLSWWLNWSEHDIDQSLLCFGQLIDLHRALVNLTAEEDTHGRNVLFVCWIYAMIKVELHLSEHFSFV